MARCHFYLLVVQVAILLTIGQCGFSDLKVLYEWTLVDFKWPSRMARAEAIRNQTLIPENVLIWDVNVYFHRVKDQQSCSKAETIIFVTTPREKTGVPAVLSTVETRGGMRNPLLIPFPSWEYNREGNCNGITNVFTTVMDKCQRLWVLDTGNLYGFADQQPQKICQPQIHIFDDLKSGGRLVGRYPVPDSVLVCNSLLYNIVVDPVVESGSCNDQFAYISDDYGRGLIVFSLRNKTFTRVEHNSFYPDPEHGDFSVIGYQFQYMDGILGQSLGPIRNGNRYFYYHPHSSVRQSYVSTSVLRDQRAFLANPRAYPDAFHTFTKKRLSQTLTDGMTADGIMFFNLMSQNALACWNSQRDPNFENTPVVAQNDTTMQYISGLKVFDSQLFAISNRGPNYYFGTVPLNETNYRVLYGCVPKFIDGTACQRSGERNYYYN